jgi:hypothetical protein
VWVTEHRDRVLEWETELLRLASELHELPDAARAAVLDTVARFLREDAVVPTTALDDAA